MDNYETQKSQVLKHLLRHGSITSWGAITKYRITRLSEYIRILREENYHIKSEWKVKNKKKFVEYKWVK